MTGLALDPNELPDELRGRLPLLADDEEFWKGFVDLVVKHIQQFSDDMNDTLNTLLLFVRSPLTKFCGAPN